jgi:putative nucleotidyltransferase with HDIG domain
MTTSVRPPAAAPDQLDALLDAIDELPSIPETLFRVLQIVDDPRSSAKSLADVIRFDAPLTAKILRLANSPFYNGGGELSDIRSCIAVLGFPAVRQVAICISVATRVVGECKRRECHLDYRALWRHSVSVGCIAKHLARELGDQDPEEVFTAGLLHDLGKFVLVLNAPSRYEHAIAERRRRREPLVHVEREAFGFDHTSAGQAFGMAWRFPRVLRAVARGHHGAVGAADGDARLDRRIALVALADHLAHVLEPLGSDLGQDPDLVDPDPLLRSCDLDWDGVLARERDIRDQLARSRAFLDIT